MSHAEAFGHLRSFVVGLEVKARDLRKVLESSRDKDGKWTNGKDGTGIGERCARAIGAASPEQVTKDMIEGVAEQDKLMRQLEDTMQTENPVQEATEKYQALVEYNQLALEDLEERLSAYGYVRPARVCLNKEGDVDPPAASSVARLLPARAKKAAKSGKKKSDRGRGGSGGGAGGGDDVAAAGSDPPTGCREEEGTVAAPDGSSPACQQQQQQGDEEEGGVDHSGGGLEAEIGETAESSAGASSGTSGGGDHSHGGEQSAAATGEREMGEEDDTTPADQKEDGGAAVAREGVATPARPASAAREREEPEEEEGQEPGSPPTPASPGLADWEITEETREMLRRAQPHLQHQQQRQAREETNAAAPRSLEALLAENTAVSAAGAGADLDGTASGGGGGRRFSVSSDWSPPPSTTKDALSRYGGSSSSSVSPPQTDVDGRGRVAVGVDAGAGSPKEGVRGAGTAEMATVATEAEAGASASVLMSAWGCSSNPPTPARMGFEDEAPWTPEGREPAVAGAGDKESSLGSPELSFRSPLKSDATAFLAETAMSCGKHPDASTPSEEESNGPAVSPPPKPTPITRSSLQGDEASLEGSLPKKGPKGDFWGNTSPASSVVASSQQEATGEQPAPLSPATPATPKALSPRFQIESSGGSDTEVAASAAGFSGRVTRSSSREMALTPNNVAGSSGVVDNDNTSGGGSSSNDNEGVDGYDSETCPTPELSSPLRSTNISARDLQVLTPSAARADYRSNTGGESCGRSGGGGGDDRDSSGDDSDACPTPELSSPLRSAGSAALCRRRLEEAGGAADDNDDDEAVAGGGPLELVSEKEYAKAPKFLTIQVSRSVLNDTIDNLNAYAAPRLGSPSELMLTVDEIMAVIDKGDLSRTLLLSAAHLKRIEMKGPRMYRIRAS